MNEMNIAKIDLNLLSVFRVLCEERQVSKAATKLGLSQPAVSHALTRLRYLLQDPLFVRSAKGVQPTALALELIKPVEDALQTLEQALFQRPAFDPQESKRKFVISADDFIGGTLINEVVKVCTREAPHIQISIQPIRNTETVDALTNGSIDMALRVNPKQAAGIKKRKLFSETFVVVMDQGHDLADKTLTLKRYIEAPHVLVSFSGDLQGVVDRELQKKGLKRHVRYGIPNFSSAPWAVLDSDAIITLPQRVAKQFAQNMRLKLCKPPLDIPGFEVSLVWHQRTQKDQACAWLREKFYEMSDKLL